MHLKSLDQILSVPAFSKKELIYLLYHTPLFSTVPLIKDTSQTLGKKQIFRLFIKTMKSLFQVTTGQYLSYAKMEKQWNDVSIKIASYQTLTPFQSGFVPGDSTTCKLLHTYHMFGEVVDNSKEVRTVFCDISKAFDQVWIKGLLHKLRGIGCSGNVLAWFSGRKQRVVINGKFSERVEVLAGVPHGSILGPLRFLIYINDIVKRIGGSIRLFAYNTSLYIIVDLPEQAARILNADLQTISKWANSWLVTFNPSKLINAIIS